MKNKQTKKASRKPAAPKPLMKKLRKALDAQKTTDPIPGPGQIVIRNGNGAKVIEAERLADYFAIHPETPGAKRWAVTHVPTGLRCGGPFRNQTLARFVATELRALGGDETWQFTKPEGLPKTPALMAKIRDLANPQSAETAFKSKPKGVSMRALRADLEADIASRIVEPPPTPVAPGPKKADQSWRSGIDWVAAGKKAYESRLANQKLREEAIAQAAAEAARAQAEAEAAAKAKPKGRRR